MDTERSPYLSIVTSSRNDNHGDRMSERMQTTLSALIAQLERYKVKSEIVLIDYNPPHDRPLLKDALQWPDKTIYCTVRNIIVPLQFHKRFKYSDKLPFNGSFSQNTGIRRARGKFVLVTPIDNLFSNELIEFIAKENIDGSKIYRTDRLDVSRKALEITSMDERLEFCRKNVTWIHTRYGSIPVVRRKKKHPRSGNLDYSVTNENLPKLHTNGTDFLLMSKESWHSLRGFPVMDTFDLYMDGLLCYMAYFSGIEEEILPEPLSIYHIEHDSRWRSIHPSFHEKTLFYFLPDKFALKLSWLLNGIIRRVTSRILRKKSKLECLAINPISREEYRGMIYDIKDGKRPISFNDDKWGLGDEQLEECFIIRAEWDNPTGILAGKLGEACNMRENA